MKTKTTLRLIGLNFLILCLTGLISAPPIKAYDAFPRLYGSRVEPGDSWEQYSRYPILSIGIHKNSVALHTQIKNRNPDIKIIGYVASQEINNWGSSRDPMDKLYQLVDENNWWSWAGESNPTSCNRVDKCSYPRGSLMPEGCWDATRGKCHAQNWPGTWDVDLTDNCPLGQGDWANYRWNNGMPKFLSENLLNKQCGHGVDCWDGIFFDNYFYRDNAWNEGSNKILDQIRTNDPDKISVINGQIKLDTGYQTNTNSSDVCPYKELADYFLQEHFLGGYFKKGPNQWYGVWDGHMRAYFWWMKHSTHKGWISSFSLADGEPWPDYDQRHNYQRVRFGLTSTLMSDGYFSYRPFHGATLWYDEFSINLTGGRTTQTSLEANDFHPQDDAAVGYLGQPLEDARAATTSANSQTITLENTIFSNADSILNNRAWQREFQNGLVIVNPTTTRQTITNLGSGQYRRILGIQDPAHNNGQIIQDNITLEPEDGIILLKINFPSPTPTPTPPQCTPCTNGANRHLGDANCNSKIDIDDMEIWREQYILNQSNNQLLAAWDADFTCDGYVNLTDKERWQNNYILNLSNR